MSPIPSVATAFTLPPAASSIALNPDSAGQSASVMSQHLLGTGGLLFAMVAIVSVAGYFYHGRGRTNSAQKTNTWVTLSGLLSSLRQWGSATTPTEAATDWPVDLEVGFEQHVSMVYARFFHPTFWNLVECHPATPSAPAIYVEDEADEIPMSDPRPPGMNSFLDMDEDGRDEDEDDGTQHAREKPDQDGRPKVKAYPPYDTSSLSNVNFSNEIIGTTVRPGGFLSVPGELEDRSSESSESYHDSDSAVDYPCSPYDGIASPDSEVDFPRSPYDRIAITDPESDLSRPPCDGIARTDLEVEFCSPYDGIATIDSEVDFPCSPGDGIATTDSKSDFSCSPYDGIPTIDSDFEVSRLAYDEPTISNLNISVHDSRDGSVAPHEGLDFMRRLLAELRDPNLDCDPRPLSEDGDSEYSADDDEEAASVPRLTSRLVLYCARRSSLESTSTPGIDSDVSDEGPIYPLTPPSKPSLVPARTPNVHLDRMSPPVVPRLNEEVLVTSPRSWDSPPSFPTKAYVRSHRDNRQCGLPTPLLSLPRL